MAKVDGRRNRKKVKKPLKPAQRKKLAESMIGNKNSVGNEGGRPVEYTKQLGRKIYNMLLAMVPVVKICGILEISRDTYYRWIREIPEFSDICYRGTYGIDHEMVVSLARRAKGYRHKVVKPFKVKDEKTGADIIIDHHYVEAHVPDVRALEIWLRNRSQIKKDWSNLPDEAAPPPPPTVNVNQIDLSKLDDATISKILRAIKPPDVKG